MKPMVKFEVFLPESHLESMIKALNEMGALTVGAYDFVYTTSEVDGYWRPLKEAKPYSGEIMKKSTQKEIRLEFHCNEGITKKVIQVIQKEHPYETPVYRIFQMHNYLYE